MILIYIDRNIFQQFVVLIWNIFDNFVANFKSHIGMNIFSPSLFPEQKGDFNPADFESGLGDWFYNILRKSYNTSISQVNELPEACSIRCKATVMHEVAYDNIRTLINQSAHADEFTFVADYSGNKRLFFMHRNYVFVLHKDGASHNDTNVTKTIDNQNGDFHYITLTYLLNDFHNEILSLVLSYPGVYTQVIPMAVSVAPKQMETVPEPEAIKPKLKIRKKDAM